MTRPASPFLARRLLALCLHDVDQELVLGDLEETYLQLAEHYGRRRARRWYWSQVGRSVVYFISRSLHWSIVMFKSYLTLARRRLIKEGAHTAINVFGMATALALCIVAFINWQYAAEFDAFHENGEQIYRINSVKSVGGGEEHWGLTPRPLADAIEQDIPGVERVARWYSSQATVRRGDVVFNERIALADPAFLDMFTFPLAEGSKEALTHGDRVILSRSMADKYFKGMTALNEELVLEFDNGRERTFTVGGILEEYPSNSSIQMDILLPMDAYLDVEGVDPTDWRYLSQLTFVQVANTERIPDLELPLRPYVAVQNQARPDWKIARYYAEPLANMTEQSRTVRGHGLNSGVPYSAVIGPAVMAIIVLIMACFNFINLSIVSSGGRMKEIGLRKVMGGRRRQMVGQLLGESLLLCFLALGLALYLAVVLTPMYNSLWPFIDLTLDYSQNLPLLGFLVLLTVLTALFAGLYPAWQASAFSPVRILRGTQKTRGATVVSRALLGMQYSLTIIGVAGSIVFVNNARYQEQMDLGYERDALLVIPLTESLPFEPFREALQQQPGVEHVAGSVSHIGSGWFSSTVRFQDEDYTVDLFEVGDDYVETTGLRIVDGRAFSQERTSDAETGILVNETFVRQMGWSDPVGMMVTMSDSVRYSVIGVVEDFYQNGVWRTIRPSVLRLAEADDYAVALVKTTPERLEDVSEAAAATWRKMAPTVPYDGHLQNDLMVEGITVSRSIRKMFFFVGILDLLIAGTGLFALVSLTIQRRTKEIGIRKVLGASVLNIGRILNTPFIVLIGVAAVFAAVGGYFLLDMLLGSIYAYHAEVGARPFVVAALLTLAIALLTVSGKVYRAGTRDPIQSLRSE